MTKLGKDVEVRESKYFDIQRRVVAHMTKKAWDEIPHAGGTVELDVTDFFAEFKAFRKKRREDNPEAPRLTLNMVILKIIAEGLKAAPEMNAHMEYYNPNSKTAKVNICEQINMAIPLITPGEDPRTITPIIPDVGNKSLDEIALYVADLNRRIVNSNINEILFKVSMSESLYELRHGKLSVIPRGIKGLFGKHKVVHLKGEEKKAYYAIPEEDRLTEKDIMSATILVSNIGSALQGIDIKMSLIEIIPPQVCVIGIPAIMDAVRVYKDEKGEKQMGIRKILPFTIMIDHRWLDFLQMIPFIKRFDYLVHHTEEIWKM